MIPLSVKSERNTRKEQIVNRASNQGMLDANSQLPISFQASPQISINTTTVVGVGPGVFHGFLVVTTPGQGNTYTAYDSVASTTAVGISPLSTTTVVGVLNSTTAAGALTFQWGGDVVFNNGLVIVSTQGTAGVIKILYL